MLIYTEISLQQMPQLFSPLFTFLQLYAPVYPELLPMPDKANSRPVKIPANRK